MPIRLVIADDSYIIREGVRELARGLDDIEVVAACGDLDTLKAAVERDRPDVVLTDIRMPPTNTDEGPSGQGAAAIARSAPPPGR